MLLFPNCKINLGLDILRRRTDGFHDIETVMLPIEGLHDGLEIIRLDDVANEKCRNRGATEKTDKCASTRQDGGREASTNNAHGITKEGEAVFTSSGLTIDCPPDDNLILRAYELMRRKFRIGSVRIHLHKTIPFGAGLGGGSANAAFTIKGLNDVFDLRLAISEMESLAAELGSDTPFFIGDTPRLCSGRGEIMAPADVSRLSGKHILIVKPDIKISTAEAYSGVSPATPQHPLADRVKMPIETWKDVIFNDFEKTIFKAHPTLGRIKSSIYEAGAIYASMSGSGSALYGIFDDLPAYEPIGSEKIYRTRLR